MMATIVPTTNNYTADDLNAHVKANAAPAYPTGAVTRAKQVAAGVGEIPAIPAHLLSMGNTLADLGNRYLPHALTQAIGDIVPDSVAAAAHTVGDKAGQLGEYWDNLIRGAIGLPKGDPLEKGDLVGALSEGAGGLLGPGMVGKLLPKVGKIAAQVAMVPASIAGKVAVGGLQAGVDTAYTQLIPPQPKPYSIDDLNQGVTDVHINGVVNKANAAAPDPVVDHAVGKTAGILSNAQYTANLRQQGADPSEWHVPTWMYAAGAITAGVLAAKYIKTPKLYELGDKFGPNAKTTDAILSKVDELATGQIDQNAAITIPLRKAGAEHAAQFVDTTQLPGTLQSAVESTLTTGRIPEASDIKLPSFMDLANKFAGMPADAQEMLSNALRAKDKLSYYKSHPHVGTGGGETIEELKDMASSADMVPELKDYVAQYKSFTDGMAQYMERMGVLTPEAMRRYTSPDYFYMPNFVKEGKSYHFLDSFTPTGQSGSGFMPTPGALMAREAVPDGVKVMHPVNALEQYTMQMMDYSRQNKVRRDFVDTMQHMSDTGATDFKGVATKTTSGGPQTVPVRRDGKVEYWVIKNPTIRTALEFQPQTLEGVLSITNKMRRLMQMGTTGVLAPLQAVANFAYDSQAAAFLTDAGKPLGAFRGDLVSSTVRSLSGAYTGVKDRLFKQAASYLNYAYNSDSVLAAALGKPTVERLAMRAADAYQNSVTAMMEKFGATHGGMLHDDAVYDRTQSILGHIAPEFVYKVPQGMRTWNLYMSVLEGIQNGARTAYFKKYGAKAATYADQVREAYQTRNLVGDYAKMGNSPFARGMRAIVPYYNPTIASMSRIGRQFRRYPGRTAAAVAGGALMPAAAASLWMMQASQAHKQWYLNELSPYERTAFVWLPLVDFRKSIASGSLVYRPPQESVGIPLLPELRPLAAMSSAIVRELTGADSSLSQSDQTRDLPQQSTLRQAVGDYFGLPASQSASDLSTSVQQALPIGTPPAAEAVLNAFGKSLPLGSNSISDIKPDIYSETPFQANMRTAIGSLLGWAGQFAMQTAGAYGKAKPGTKVDRAIEQAEIQIGQKLPTVAAPIAGYQRKLSASTVDADIYYSKVNALQNIQTVAGAYTKQLQGMAGNRMSPTASIGMLPSVVDDPQVALAMQVVAKFAAPLDHLKATVTQYKTLIDQTNARSDIGPKQKASIINTATRREHAAQNQVVQFIQNVIEKQLTQMAGKPTMVEDLQPH